MLPSPQAIADAVLALLQADSRTSPVQWEREYIVVDDAYTQYGTAGSVVGHRLKVNPAMIFDGWRGWCDVGVGIVARDPGGSGPVAQKAAVQAVENMTNQVLSVLLMATPTDNQILGGLVLYVTDASITYDNIPKLALAVADIQLTYEYRARASV